MKRKSLLLLAITSIVMITMPYQVWAENSKERREVNSVKTLPYPRATEPVPAAAMEYDSAAKCFVVRDTIMKVNPLTRSAVASTIETRAAVAYTEDGVQYGYFGDQLSSDKMDEMRTLIEPWGNDIKNLDIESILTPASNGDETWYMQIVGVDNDEIDSREGEMRIYNDIGSSYNYKTIAIDGTALRGNEHIKKIVFEDCASSSANANTKLKMVIHDGAFQNCSNLQELNMYYLVTDGTNHYDMLLPTDVYIGSNVFDGCHEDFRIVVDAQVYKMFLADANWSQYADKIVASNQDDLQKTEEAAGVKYGYFGYQLSSSSMDKMELLVEPWAAQYRNLDIDELLAPASNGDETWYMQIAGVDNDKLDSREGEMRIYNDIGTTYNYKTIAIDSTALRGNEHIKKVVFEDCASASENANTRLKMVIHDGAFKDCKNLREFNMYNYVTEGGNHYEMLYPSDIYIGKNVFDDCHEDFRIVVAPQLYNMFTTDANWSQYADKIVASDYMPTKYDPITVDGVTYDYAANSLNTLPTSELTRLQSSWWNAAIIGIEVAIAIATYGASSATTSAQAALNAAQQAQADAIELVLSETRDLVFTIDNVLEAWEAGGIIFAHKTIGTCLSTSSLSTLMGNATTAAATLTAKEIALAAAMSNYTFCMMAAGISAGTIPGINALEYISSTVGNKTRREPTWIMNGQWLMTECKHTIYHMYVKDVENKETVTLYNDIGSAYNYKTVGIGNTAFHNKDKIKTIKFQDLYANASEMYASMTVTIPDKAFKGCTSLETLDLIMHSIDTKPDRDVALGPENFILCGEDIFEGCDMSKLKIRIGAEKYEEFAENPIWGKYKDNFEVVDLPKVVDYTEYGAQYSYSFDNNALKKQSYISDHTIEHLHVVGQDADDLADQEGELGLFNDIGSTYNYKLDYVKKKAFYGSQELKGISMFDLVGAAGFGDSYTDLELVLQDSAFAYCPNLEHINMLYFRTDGTNSVEPMSPSRVMLGNGVFAGNPNFKVKMVTTAVDEFKADTAWAKYEDRFLPSFIQTQDEVLMEALEACGMEYESPVTGGSFDIYDVMQVTDPTVLDGKFQGKKIAAFREFKAFECINLTAVGSAWFKDCIELQGIELPSTLNTIEQQAFYNCQLLDDVVIPAGVTTIGNEAFRGCASLRSLTFLSETPATLGTDVFAEMPDDYVLYVPDAAVETYKEKWSAYANHIQAVSTKPTGVYEVTLTEPGTLAEKLGLTITGTDPLTISGNYGKYDSLKVVGPINGTDMGVIRIMCGRDVDNCENIYPRNLKYLDLYDAHIRAGGEDYNQDGSNDRITEDDCIDTYMFWELDVLETLILPKSVTKIKDYAFNNCDRLSRLVIGDNTKSIGEEVTYDSPKLREVILLCNEVPATDGDAWAEEKTIMVFYAPNAIRDHLAGSRAYYTRGDSIASPFAEDAVIRAMAEKRIYTIMDMYGMKDFEHIVNGNTEITLFNELLFAMEVTMLGDNSLSGCRSLEQVALPYSLETITAGAFRGCTSLTRINVTCDTIPTLAPDAFKDLPEEFVIMVEPGKEEAYRRAWPQYADHIQGFKKPANDIKVVTVTKPGTLGEALGFVVNMDTPSDVGRIDGNLSSIKALKVIGPINGKDIAVLRMLGGRDEEDANEVALARMTYLDLYEATICTDPDNICFNRDGANDYVEFDNEIPEHMFWKLDRLQTVILPRSVTKIADNAFYDNIGIETIVIGDATVEIGNDVFGKCKNLKHIVLLCNEKAALDGDAFTDPISDQPYQVEKMYVPLSMYNAYVGDEEYTTHTKEFCTNYMDDALFRAYGSHAVMDDDQLKGVTSVDGWFDHHTGVKDLTSLGLTAIDTLKAATLSPLKELERIAFPATLAVVEAGAFATNDKLQWADFAECTDTDVLTQSNIAQMGFGPYALVYAPEGAAFTGLTNVVYGTEGNLKCDQYVFSDKIAYAVPRQFIASEVRYDRLFTQGETATLYLPFDMELPSGVKAYMLTDEIVDTVLVAQVESMEANCPYVIMADEDATFTSAHETVIPVTPNRTAEPVATPSYAMYGTLAPISAKDAEAQRMYVMTDATSWTLVEDAAEGLSPYSVYMQAVKPNAPATVAMREAYYHITDGACTEFVNPKNIIARLTYTRTLNSDWNAFYVPFQWELTEEVIDNYDIAYINDVRSHDKNDDGQIDEWDIEIIKIKQPGSLKANHPYVVRPKNTEAKNLNITQVYTTLYSTTDPQYQHDISCSSVYKQYTVKGVYAKTVSAELDNGNFVYAVNKSGLWQKMNHSTALAPFRIYLTMANKDGSPIDPHEVVAQSIRMRLVGEESEDDTTLIYDLEVDEECGNDHIYDLQGRRVLEPKRGSLYIVNGKKMVF